jgi:DtxR family Mn-dependent transcriptional regulator
MALTEAIQDYLEKLYWFQEAGIEPTQANLARAMQVSQPSVTEMVRRLVDEGLVERDERKRLHFTPHGEEIARHIVSRHRLIEAFLVKVFGIPWDEVHEEAHTFEHAISPNLEQRMYELLADAETCPHGHPIGDAPREPGEQLAGAAVGSRVRVLRLENEDPELLRLFKRTGVEPGDTITVTALSDDLLTLETREGSQTVPVPAAQTVSVIVEERGDGPVSDAADLTAEAMLAGTSWGR